MIQIQLAQELVEVEKGSTIQDIIGNHPRRTQIYAGVFNGKLHDIKYRLKENGILEYIYAESETGKQIYERSLNFLFIVAVKLLHPASLVFMEHALSNGQYCEIKNIPYLTPKDVDQITNKMLEMVEQDEEIHRKVVSTEDAIVYFKEKNMESKANLLCSRSSKTSSIYTLCDVDDYFYGIMLPSTAYLTHFSLRYYAPGVWLSASDILLNQTKLFQVFQEFEQWGKLIGVSNVAQLNKKILEGKMDELVLMSETMVEKKLADVANMIVKDFEHTKFILIAGPSSAGKTTFSRRLAIHLKIMGKEPMTISMDHFYRNREDCPKLEDGSYDFECLEALDLELFNGCMLKLLHKEAVRLPIFNFKTGFREWQENELCLEENQILIIEGIQGLNPETSKNLPEESKFKIYINALTHLNLDEHNRIPTSDYRLLRRIARDYQFRGWSAKETIHFWKNVKDGEDKFIYPYQEEANYIFNSSMVYELSILKGIVTPLLEVVKKEDKEYLEANRLKKLIAYFETGNGDAVPRDSIFAEFIGNSIFKGM